MTHHLYLYSDSCALERANTAMNIVSIVEQTDNTNAMRKFYYYNGKKRDVEQEYSYMAMMRGYYTHHCKECDVEPNASYVS